MMLKPDYLVAGTVDELSLQQLRQDGISGLILDLDNTIMLPREGLLSSEMIGWLRELNRLGLKGIVVTNNKSRSYVRQVMPVLREFSLATVAKAGKPNTRKLARALVRLGLPASEVCVIGDRVATDVWGGHRLGAKTALVQPLLGSRENPVFRALRSLERWVMLAR